MSTGAAPLAGRRIQTSYLLALGAVLFLAVTAVTWPRVAGWRAHRHTADIVSAETLLYGLTSAPQGLAIDETDTACHGLGDLCVQSDLTPEQTLATLTSKLSRAGFSWGSIDCTSKALGAFPAGGAVCQATGSRRTAHVWALVGTHHNRYWPTPTWAAVIVQDRNYVSNQPTAAASNGVDPLSVVPAGWRVTQRCLTDSAPNCDALDVHVTGDAATAADTIAKRLEELGYGIDAPPLSNTGAFCRTRPTGSDLTCDVFAFRYLRPHGQGMTTVGVMLHQGPHGTTAGRILLRS